MASAGGPTADLTDLSDPPEPGDPRDPGDRSDSTEPTEPTEPTELIDLRDLTRAALRELVRGLGEPAFRGDQLFRWIWRQGERSFDAMTNLPASLRARLSGLARVGDVLVRRIDASRDGTRKLLVGLRDGNAVEAVLIPEPDRLTLCVSSQVGCALGCRFCATGTMGLTRHLTPGEIVGQVVAAQRVALEGDGVSPELAGRADPTARPVTNIVFMGMGEPLHNAGAVLDALRILTDEDGFGYAPRRITVSTVGLIPQMLALGDELPVRLAVSLHAADTETRGRLMPVEKRYPIHDLLDACRRFPLHARERITFEYALLAGVNDAPEDARRLAGLLGDLRCKVNLLPFNEHEGAPFERPNPDAVRRFTDVLRSCGVDAFVRTTRGRDIAAACGQLALGERAARIDDSPGSPDRPDCADSPDSSDRPELPGAAEPFPPDSAPR